MRFSLVAIVGMLALSSVACSSTSARVLPKEALVARAWAGREPPTTARALEAVAFATAQVGK
ncbi:MAG: hypothetical protein ABIP89_07540, partial [Polyangiaceae bacterium]